MKGLRTVRIILSILFFVAAVAYFTMSPAAGNPAVNMVGKMQIVPSAIASGMGTVLIWLGVSLLFGRVYCSSVCPVGTLHDLIIPLRRHIKPLPGTFRYRPGRMMRYHILVVYAVCLVAGATLVCVWIEPWSMMRNICGVLRPSAAEETWLTLGVGTVAGIISGALSGILVAVGALFFGRGFCAEICPIGTALGCVHEYTLFHIEIDPDKCVNCMKCEEVCKSSCVKVTGRVVDNSRCVRCFDCLAVCPNGAIRFQVNRNRPASPLFRRVGRGAVK